MRRWPEAIAALWGFAEATLFFIVPDVWLSLMAAFNRRRALMACLWAAGGALAGGLVMFAWGRADASAALAVMERIPAVSPAMIEKVEEQVAAYGAWSLFIGPFTGTPFKLYAVVLGAQGGSWAMLVAAGAPARLLRFALVSLTLGTLAQRLPERVRIAALLSGWLAFYLWFFNAMP